MKDQNCNLFWTRGDATVYKKSAYDAEKNLFRFAHTYEGAAQDLKGVR